MDNQENQPAKKDPPADAPADNDAPVNDTDQIDEGAKPDDAPPLDPDAEVIPVAEDPAAGSAPVDDPPQGATDTKDPDDTAMAEAPIDIPTDGPPDDAQQNGGITSKDASVTIGVVDMSQEQFDMAVQVAKEGLDQNDVDVDVAKYIKRKFDEIYGPIWMAVVGDSYGLFVTHQMSNFAHFYVNSKAIVLFRAM